MKNLENNVLFIILKEKKIITFGAILGFLLFLFYYIFFYVPLYNTSCKIFVKNIQKQDVVATYNGGATITSESGYSNPLFNLYEILKSENVSNRVYEKIKNKYPEDLARFGIQTPKDFSIIYQKIISSDVEPSSDILKVTLLWPNGENAPAVLQEVINQFKVENLDIKRSIEVKKRIFLDKQTNEIAVNLEKIRTKIKNYKLSTKLTNLQDESVNLVSARVDLQKQVKILESQAFYNKAKLAEYAGQLDFPDAQTALRATGIGEDPYLIKISQDLSAAQQNYARLKAKYTDKYPDVIAAKDEIELLKQNIEKRKEETIKNIKISRPIHDSSSTAVVTSLAMAQAEATSLGEQIIALNKGISEIQAEEAKLPLKQLGLEDLQKQEDAFATAYQNIKEKQLEAKIKESEIVDNLILLNGASKPLPIAAIIFTKLLGFLAVGALCGFAYAYLKQGIENKWANIEEIELVTEQTVLGTVPWLKDIDSKNARAVLDAAFTNIAYEIVSKAYLKESFILSFISTNRSRNKSLIAEILASKIAKVKSSVLLIDLVPKIKNDFDIIDLISEANKSLRFHNKNFSEIPANELGNIFHPLLKKALKTKNIDSHDVDIKMSLLELNKECVNLNDYIAAKSFSLMLEHLKQHFEFIFINAPHGLILLPEIQTLKQISEASILISSISTNRDGLIKIVDNYVRSNSKILGIITREENSEIEKSFEIFEDLQETELIR